MGKRKKTFYVDDYAWWPYAVCGIGLGLICMLVIGRVAPSAALFAGLVGFVSGLVLGKILKGHGFRKWVRLNRECEQDVSELTARMQSQIDAGENRLRDLEAQLENEKSLEISSLAERIIAKPERIHSVVSYLVRSILESLDRILMGASADNQEIADGSLSGFVYKDKLSFTAYELGNRVTIPDFVYQREHFDNLPDEASCIALSAALSKLVVDQVRQQEISCLEKIEARQHDNYIVFSYQGKNQNFIPTTSII